MSPDDRKGLTMSDDWTEPRGLAKLPPGFFLSLSMLEFVVLFMLGLSQVEGWFGIDKLPTVVFGNTLPIGAAWAAAWGGWLISLTGIVAYWSRSNNARQSVRWKERLRWNAWHLVRMPMGAVIGSFGAVLVVIFTSVLTTGGPDGSDLTKFGNAAVAMVAFVLAYRQQGFIQLIQRVLDIILVKADEAAEDAEDDAEDHSFLIPQGRFWRAPVKGTGTNMVVVVNSSDADIDLPAEGIKLTGKDAAFFVVTDAPSTVPANGAATLSVVFSPDEVRTYKAELEVQLGDTTGKVNLTGYGNKS
jgi:hypothetical protein